MGAMPGRDALERGTGTNQRRFSRMSGHELECDRQSRLRKTARQRNRRITGQVERAGISLQFGYKVRLFAERPYHGESRRRERMHWDQQQVDRAEQRGDAAEQIQPPQKDFLIVKTGERTPASMTEARTGPYSCLCDG